MHPNEIRNLYPRKPPAIDTKITHGWSDSKYDVTVYFLDRTKSKWKNLTLDKIVELVKDLPYLEIVDCEIRRY